MLEYIARVAYTSAVSLARPTASALDEVRTPMRVWLSDIDVNGHINNGRYLTLMDFARLDHSIRLRLVRPTLKRGWWPLLGAATVKFRREIRAGARFHLTTRFAWWDHKWLYFEHKFVRRDVVHAIGYVKAVIKKKGHTVPPAELLQIAGHHGPPPDPGPELQKWIEAQ